MMATLLMDRLVDLECILDLMDIVTKEYGRQICLMDMERLSTEMGRFMKVIWCKESETEKEDLCKMAVHMREISKMIKLKE